MSDADHKEATRDTYTFTPSVGADGFIDYPGVEPDKVYLASRKTILEEEYPSYLPPVHIRRNTNYDIPAYKVRDNVYLLRESDEMRRDENGSLHNPRIYKVSLDVYAALVNYHLEFDRAAFLAVAKHNEESRAKALKEGINEYPAIREKDIPIIPGRFDARSITNTYTNRYPNIEHKPSRVSLKSTKSRRMGTEAFYFIQDMNKAYDATINRGGIFRMHRECLDDVNQKILDMELQKADWESTWTKGRETSYGDTNLNDSLLQTYGIRVKRQNGENISKKEIDELKVALNRVHSIFGNISDVSQAWGLKVSHAGNTKMHASKYIGLFTPYYRAIGISFAGGEAEASLTAIHEYAHFMDHLSGKELNAWHASDIPGTLENQIAVEFRGQMIDVKGAYWSRTCECFARAIEEYAQITLIREQEVVDNFSLDSINKINAKIAKPGSVKYLPFKENIEPLVNRLLDQYRERYTNKQREVSKAELVLENTASIAIPAIPHEKTIEALQKEVYNLAVEKTRLDKEARSISEKINEERRILFEQELKRIGAEIEAIDRKLLLHSESGGDGELASDLEKQKKEFAERYNAVRYEFTPESETLSAYLEKEAQLSSRIYEVEDEGRRFTLQLMELEKKEEERKKDEKEHALLTGTFTQLELFEMAAEYSAREREEGGNATGIIEGDPHETREHIRAAKAAQRSYANGILKGTKSGLWTAFRDFKKHGVFDIQGVQVATGQDGKITREGWEQLHQALHIYRDKRFETFRVLFVTSEGVITDQLAISSHLPTRVALSSLNSELGDHVKDYAIRTNTKIVFVHNHPSGNVSPSPQDEAITKDLEATLVDADGRTLLHGHIILDHDSFGLYQANSWETMRSATQGHDPLLKTRLPEFTQEKINNAVVLRDIAEEINESDRWNSTDWVPVAFTGADARISGIRYYSKEWFETVSSNDMARQFQSVSEQTGAIWAFPIISDELAQDTQLGTAVKEHMKDGCFMDFYIAGATSEDFNLDYYRGSFFSFMPYSEVKERTTTEATFALEEHNVIIDTLDESVASKEQEEYGGQKHYEKLFQTDISPGLSAAIANISKADIGKPNVFITVTNKTPFVLTVNGLPDTKVAMYRDKIARALYLEPVKPGQRFQHGHSDGLDKEIIQKVFKELANPYYVFASKDGESQIGVYDINDKNGEPVIIAFNYNTDRNGVEANWVKALYGKNEQGIERWAEEGLLRYVNDKEKATELSITLQMRVMGSSAAYTKKILRKSAFVNSDFVRESEQEYARGNGGRKMENNGKEANSLEPFVLTNERDRLNFYTSIGIDPAEPLFAGGKSLQDITSFKENAFMLPSRQLRMSNINASLSSNIDLKSEIVNGDFVLENKSRYNVEGGIRMNEIHSGYHGYRNGSTRVFFADGRTMTHDKLKESGVIAYMYQESSGKEPCIFNDHKTFLSALKEEMGKPGKLHFEILIDDQDLRSAASYVVIDFNNTERQREKQAWLDGSGRINIVGGSTISRDEMKAEGAIAYITWNEGIYGFDLSKFYDKESFLNALDSSLRDEPNRVGFGVLVDNDDLITKAKALDWHHRIDDPEINAQYTDAQLKEYGVIAYIDEIIYGKTYRSTFQDKESLLLDYENRIPKGEIITYKLLLEDTELESAMDNINFDKAFEADKKIFEAEKGFALGKPFELRPGEYWTWESWDDGSGCLHSPQGNKYFDYDLKTKEYRILNTREWTYFPGYPDDTLSYIEFKDFAEKWITSNPEVVNEKEGITDLPLKEPKKSYNQMHTERILDSLNTGSAPFLGQPNEKSLVILEPQAIRSAVTGRAFRGMNQILAQIMVAEIGAKESELITYEQAKRHGAGIRKGSPGINLTTFDVSTKQQNMYRYYLKSSTYNRDKLPTLPQQEKHLHLIVECSETLPEKYLGKYLAATSLGARFETSKDTMKAFKTNLEEDLSKSYAEKNYTRIYELGNKASVVCQNTMSDIGKQVREAERIRQKASEVKSGYEPYNPITGEKFVGLTAKKAQYVMARRESLDPRFLELSDILKAGLKLSESVKEPLIITDQGKSRFFYNAKDIEGIPPIKIKTISLNQQRRNTNTELQL